MKTLIALTICAAALSAQTSVQVAVKFSTTQKIWNILLRPKTVLADFACVAAELEPGESTACTVTLNQSARFGGVAVVVSLPAGFTGPPAVTIPAGATATTFQILRVDLVGYIGPRMLAAPVTARVPGRPAVHWAQVMVPCVARLDRCGNVE